jgi:hypothetical protein
MNFENPCEVRFCALELAMELHNRKEIRVSEILTIADTFEKFINFGKPSTDFHLGVQTDCLVAKH